MKASNHSSVRCVRTRADPKVTSQTIYCDIPRRNLSSAFIVGKRTSPKQLCAGMSGRTKMGRSSNARSKLCSEFLLQYCLRFLIPLRSDSAKQQQWFPDPNEHRSFLFRCDYEATQKSHLVRHLETHNVVKRFQCQHCDYSANTLGYIKIHYTRMHEGCAYTPNPDATTATTNPETKVYKCLSCDYLFGNLSDMKRHLKVRHHVQVGTIICDENKMYARSAMFFA